MPTTFPRESAWKAVAQKHRLRDNGLQKALAVYERLDEDKYVDRIKALDAAKKFAASLGKAREVAANGEASRFLDQLEASAESTKRAVTAAAASAAGPGGRPIDVAAIRASAVALRSLPNPMRTPSATTGQAKDAGQCGAEEDEVATAHLALLIAAAAIVTACVNPSSPAMGAIVIGAMGTTILAIRAFKQKCDALLGCYRSHPDAYRERMSQLEKVKRALAEEEQNLRRQIDIIQRWVRTQRH